jgi:cell division protein FtsX
MINFQEILKKTLLKDEEKFFHGLSFVVISLITINIAIYFNFYKFSSNWIESESRKTTFIISNYSDEKEIPLTVTENIEDFLSKNNKTVKFRIIEPNLIKESLGLTNFADMSGLKVPFIFQIETDEEDIVDMIYSTVLRISENRLTEKYSHKDQLFEISSVVDRIKVIIFVMFLVILTLFAFLVLNIVRAALVSNYKFLEILQIMGSSSFELSKNISQSIVRKIIPGAILSIIFVYFVSTLLIKLFGANFHFFNASYFVELNIKTLIILILFLVIFLVLLLIFLTMYLFYFFEKRFFDKF